MQAETLGNVEARIYVGSHHGVIPGEVYTTSDLITALRDARYTLHFLHPLRITATVFMCSDGNLEEGWEIAANRQPGQAGVGEFGMLMRKLAHELALRLNQRKVIVVTNYETVVIENKELK